MIRRATFGPTPRQLLQLVGEAVLMLILSSRLLGLGLLSGERREEDAEHDQDGDPFGDVGFHSNLLSPFLMQTGCQ